MAAVFSLAAAIQPAGAVNSIDTSAYGLTAHFISRSPGGSGTAGSVAPVSAFGGTAPGPYNGFQQQPSFDFAIDLGDQGNEIEFSQALQTGLVRSTASSPFPQSPTGTATSRLNNVVTRLQSVARDQTTHDFLDLSATSITSTSSVSGLGSLKVVGSSQFQNLLISGSALGLQTIGGSAFNNPAPNTVVFNSGGLKIILNEQFPGGDGVNSANIQTFAFDAIFTDFQFGQNLLTGRLFVGESSARITGRARHLFSDFTNGPALAAVPEPAAWAEMLVGFGITGLLMRRRGALKRGSTAEFWGNAPSLAR